MAPRIALALSLWMSVAAAQVTDAGALEQAGTKNMTFAVDVVLGPGTRQISVGVLDQRSEQTGFELVSVGL